MSKSIRWVLDPQEVLFAASDEFAIGNFRFQLQDASLTVTTLEEEIENLATEAGELAERYAASLRKNLPSIVRLRKPEELNLRVSQIITSNPPTLDPERLSRGLGKARNELLGSQNLRLRQCYDYMQAAREAEEDYLFFLYKLVETVEDEFGGEGKATKPIDRKADIKFIKRLANESRRDVRHPPKESERAESPSKGDRKHSFDCARRVLHVFEDKIYRRRRK